MRDATERLWKLLEGYLVAEGIELDDVELAGKGRGTVLRVTVDAQDGIGVDRLADLSRGLSRLLDEEDPVQGSYRLEVSSPGLERKLRRPEHYRKSVGREVKVKTTEPVDDERLHEGVLGEVDEDGFVIQLNGGERRIGFGQVATARTVFTWERGAKPGKARR